MLKFKYIKMVVDELDSKARWNRHLRLPDTKHKAHLEILPYRFSALSVTVPNHLDCDVSHTLGWDLNPHTFGSDSIYPLLYWDQ